ncbi:MAG: hypothetical protein PHV18_04410 [Lachnospiraceae bacterium]|nr:hypothetical protein [Lachnospiraceae bacterium]
MAGIGIKEIKTVEITTTDGRKLAPGDLVCIRVRGQDVICHFLEMEKNNYFVTSTVTSTEEAEKVKYRLSSIEQCFKVENFKLMTDPKQGEPEE